MKKRQILALVLAFLFVTAVMTGCSSGSDGEKCEIACPADQIENSMPGEGGFAEEEADLTSLPQPPGDAKLIYTGHITLETMELESSAQALTELVGQFGGFYEQQELYHRGDYQNGTYTVRVPSEQFEAFLNAVGENPSFRLTYRSTSCENVSEVYGDIENRMETLQIKQDRLQVLLEQAESMDDIIAIESELTEVEAELAALGGEKNHYDNLIGYSTVYVDLREVGTFSEGVNPSFGQRLISGFQRGLQNFAEGVENLLVLIVSNLLTIAVFVLVVVLAICLIRKHRKQKKAKQPEQTQ